jgi:hypothetical protein
MEFTKEELKVIADAIEELYNSSKHLAREITIYNKIVEILKDRKPLSYEHETK